MKLISDNPFRIAGILANSTERELQRQKAKILAFSKVGRELDSEFEFDFLESQVRKPDDIESAFTSIGQNSDKVFHSLFWFINVSPIDKAALEYLKRGNKEKAEEIWGKLTKGKAVSSKNFSAFNNLGTCKLAGFDSEEIKEGLEAKLELINSPFFKDFVTAVADENFNVESETQISRFVSNLLEQFKKYFSSEELLELFANSDDSVLTIVKDSIVGSPIYMIESDVEICKKERKKDKSNSFDFGIKLYENNKENINLIKRILGKEDLNYNRVTNLLAKEILQCGIDFINSKESETESDINFATQMIGISKSLATKKILIDRIEENLKVVSDLKSIEIVNAINLLSYFIDEETKLFDEWCNQMERTNYNYWREYRGLNWSKVVEVIIKEIPRDQIKKIKRTEDKEKIRRYKDLVKVVLSYISENEKSEVQYLKYWIFDFDNKFNSISTKIKSFSLKNYLKSLIPFKHGFYLAEEAWWVLILIGGLIGGLYSLSIKDEFWDVEILFGGLLGLILRGVINRPWVLIFPALGYGIGIFLGENTALPSSIIGGFIGLRFLV